MSKSEEKSIVKQWWFWMIIVASIAVVVAIIVAVVCLMPQGREVVYKGSDSAATAIITRDETKTNTAKNNVVNKKNPTLGDTIEFDGFEITFGTTISFVTVDNEYSDYYGRDIIKLPVTVKNVGTETGKINMYSFDLFGSKGTELSSVDFYFDDTVSYMDKLRPGASTEANFYLLYDGNGTYGIDFEKSWSSSITVEFNVEK